MPVHGRGLHLAEPAVGPDHHRGRGRPLREDPQQRVPLQPSIGGGEYPQTGKVGKAMAHWEAEARREATEAATMARRKATEGEEQSCAVWP